MTTSPRPGDIVIRALGESSYALVDATAREQIAVAPDLQTALRVASEYGGAVWRENLDSRGHPLGKPVLLLPSASIPRP